MQRGYGRPFSINSLSPIGRIGAPNGGENEKISLNTPVMVSRPTIPLPTLFLAAALDELFCPKATQVFASEHGNTRLEFQTVGDSTHLGCVFAAHHFIANWQYGKVTSL